ncbi:hypothetical protein FRC12_010566 [Ceratobasidium sp. 428]|nr:hypothetical protein FRC12_010566 [Ceratobasidium sp. 428]
MLEGITSAAIRKATLQLGTIPRIENVAVILMFGATGAGKSSYGNHASGIDQLAVGDDIESCTKQAQLTNLFVVDQKPVVIVDFPGFDDTLVSNADLLTHIIGFLEFLHKHNISIVGLFYFHPITHNRLQGSDTRNYHIFREMCGSEAIRNVVIVTTMWSKPPTQRELNREKQLRDSELAFRDILHVGAQITRHSEETRESALNVLRLVLDKTPVVPLVSRQIVDRGMKTEETNAGRALGKEFQDHMRKARQEIEELKVQLANEQEEERKRLQARIDTAEKERLEAELAKKQEEEQKKVQEQAAAEMRRQLEEQLAREQEAKRQMEQRAEQAERERLAAELARQQEERRRIQERIEEQKREQKRKEDERRAEEYRREQAQKERERAERDRLERIKKIEAERDRLEKKNKEHEETIKKLDKIRIGETEKYEAQRRKYTEEHGDDCCIIA